MVEFWYGWKNKLSDYKGDYIKTFLRQLSETSYILSISENLTTDGQIKNISTKEGWINLDGSEGIRIVSGFSLDIDDFDFNIEEINK